jgi:hypothetical protein
VLVGVKALASTGSNWPRNGSSSELAGSYDDPGAGGTHDVESRSTPSSLAATTVSQVAIVPPTVSMLTLPPLPASRLRLIAACPDPAPGTNG